MRRVNRIIVILMIAAMMFAAPARLEMQKQNKDKNDKEISTYILNYSRNKKELNKIPLDTGIKKAEKCFLPAQLQWMSCC